VNLVLADSGFFENKLQFDCNGAMAIIRKWLLGARPRILSTCRNSGFYLENKYCYAFL